MTQGKRSEGSCSRQGCTKDAKTNGMCKNHAEKDRVAALPFICCLEIGCEKDRRHGARGRCAMHAKRFRLYGDASVTIRIAGGRPLLPCSAMDCETEENINWAPHCAMHGSRLRRNGSTGGPERLVLDRRAAVLVAVAGNSGDDCVEFPAALLDDNGYGLHRAAYESSVGRKIRPSFEVDHMCRNRSCGNPSHLEEVSKSENMARMWAARKYIELHGEPGSAFWLVFFRDHWTH